MDVPPHLQEWQFIIFPRVANLPSWQNGHVAVLETAIMALTASGASRATFVTDGTLLEVLLVLPKVVFIDIV